MTSLSMIWRIIAISTCFLYIQRKHMMTYMLASKMLKSPIYKPLIYIKYNKKEKFS